jgi:hypothetical protein
MERMAHYLFWNIVTDFVWKKYSRIRHWRLTVCGPKLDLRHFPSKKHLHNFLIPVSAFRQHCTRDWYISQHEVEENKMKVFQTICKWHRHLCYINGWVLQKLLVAQLLKIFPVVYGTQNVIIAFKRACHWSLCWASLIHAKFDVFIAVAMKNAVFWDVEPCRSCVKRRFGGTYSIHLQGRKIRERGTSVSRWLQTCLSVQDATVPIRTIVCDYRETWS